VAKTWGHCGQCTEWFSVIDTELDSYFLCPVCLTPADRVSSEVPENHPAQ
jgi:hypothetical protein